MNQTLDKRMNAGANLRWLPDTPLWPVVRPLYSAGVWAFSLSMMGFTAVSALAMLPVIPFPKHNRFLRWGMSRCLLATGSEIRVTFDPGFELGRPCVFCQNHISMLDAHVACSTIPHEFCGLMEAWHFKIPGYGWIMKQSKGIPVYPRASGRTAEITAEAQERASRDVSILAYPEAHRTLDGDVRDFKRGIFFMARDAGIPVVPLAVRGLYDVNHKGQFLFRPGLIDIYVVPHVETAGLDDDGVAELAGKMTAFASTWVRDGVADVEALR